MRGLQLPLTQTQKIRLQRALEKLESLALKANTNATVTIADIIPVNHDDGHGTLDVNGEVFATVCGVVERINKLVYIHTLRARYKPEVGDIIVGRVVEVVPKRWKLNINYSQDAVLMLSSINLPGGIQLCSGQLLSVPPYLVKGRKQHLHYLDQLEVDLILGCNCFIWVGEHAEPKDDMAVDQEDDTEQDLKTRKYPATLEDQEHAYTPIETRQNICRIANAIQVASTLGFTITIEAIMDTFNLTASLNTGIHEMLGPEFCVLVAEQEADPRGRTKRAG